MKRIFIFFIVGMLMNTTQAHARSLTAEIHGTSADSTISGEAQFYETAKGLKVLAHVEGAPPGKHGFHIHEKGDCGDMGNAAGGHFDPDSHAHGDAVTEGIAKTHAGDLGNIEVDAAGKGNFEKTIAGLTLDGGKYAIAGRSVILDEKEDNFGQPTGNGGGRIGCAEISS